MSSARWAAQGLAHYRTMLQQYLRTKQTELNSVGFSNIEPSPNRNLTGEIILKQVFNSPLCNSSPRVSTVVPEKKNDKKVLRLEWTPVLMSILVTAEHERVRRRWTKMQKQGHWARLLDASWMREVQDKGTSTSSWSSSHRLNGVDDKVKYAWHSQQLQLPLFSLLKRAQIKDYNLSHGVNYFVLVPSVIS